MPELQVTLARTPRHGLPFLFAGQTQKEAFVNEALLVLDTLVQPVVFSERNEPPTNPAFGDCHIVGNAPQASWTGREGCLALWTETHWLFAEPKPGASVFDRERGRAVFFGEDASWRAADAPDLPTGGPVQDSEARATLGQIVEALRVAGIFS